PQPKLKQLRETLDPEPTLGGELLQTLRWAADYYHHPLGAVLSHALPSLLREGRAIDAPPEPVWQITPLGAEQSLDELARAARRQAQALAALRHDALPDSELRALGISAATLARLQERGLIEPGVATPPTPARALVDGARALPALTPDQR